MTTTPPPGWTRAEGVKNSKVWKADVNTNDWDIITQTDSILSIRKKKV